MRLAFIKKRFSIHGGAERYLQTLIQHLKNAGHEIHIFSHQWSGEEGVIFHKVNILPFTSFLSAITFDENVAKAIKREKVDCVISLERTTCQDIYRAGEGCHAEWLQIRSKTEPFYKKLSFKINPLHIALLNLEKRLFKNTKLIIANSKMVREQIIRHYAVPEEKIMTIYNGVDLARFNPESKEKWRKNVRNNLNIPEDLKVLLFVGSGFERKGLKTLIHAMPLIKGNIKTLIIGKGDTSKYRALAERLGVPDKIMFLGTQKEIEKFYASSDLFVLPTLYDPFSNATLEAMASGIPVITTKNNGASEPIENGREGFVLNSLANPRELAEKINIAIAGHAVLGKNARLKAEDFPIEMAAREFMGAIQLVAE